MRAVRRRTLSVLKRTPFVRDLYTFFMASRLTFALEQPSRRPIVLVLTGLTAIVVAALFVYLVYAMFRAEDL